MVNRRSATVLIGVIWLMTAGAALGVEQQDQLFGYKIRDHNRVRASSAYTLKNTYGNGSCELKSAQLLLTPASRNTGDDARGVAQPGSLVCYKAKCTNPPLTSPMSADVEIGTLAIEATGARGLVCLPAIICGDGALQDDEVCDPPGSTGQCGGGLQCKTDCTCPTPPTPACTGSVMVGAGTWCLADASISCDAACTSLSKTCDAETINYAGSSGTDANCEAVLQALGIPGALTNPSDESCPSGLGCFVSGTSTYRCASPNTGCGSASFLTKRACACQ